MIANISMNDRRIRGALGVAAVVAYFLDPRPVWLILGALMLFSGLSGYSLLYHAFRYTTVEVRHSNKRLLAVLIISGVSVGLAAMAVVFSAGTPYLWQAMAIGTIAFGTAYASAMGYFCGKTCASD